MVNSTLSFLSRIFKVDFHYIATGGFYLTLSQISSALIGLGMTVAFANLISQETYGTYRYILSLYTLFAIATFPGIDTAVTQSTISGYENAVEQGFRKKISWGFLATIGALLYSAYNYFIVQNHELAYLLSMMAFSLPLMEAGTVVTSYLNGKKRFKMWGFTEIATQLFSTVSLVTVMFLSDNIYYLMLAYFIPYIIARMSILFAIKPNFFKKTIESEDDPGLYKYGSSLTFFQIATRIISSIDQIVLFHFLGPAQVAVFALAQALPMRIQSILRISGSLAFPRFANQDIKTVSNTLLQKMILFSAVIFIGCIFFIFTVPYVFTYLLPNYMQSIQYAQVLIFYCLSAITYPFASLMFAHKKITETYIVTGVNFSTKILAIIILVPLYGIWGAVWGTVISSFSNIIASILILKSVSKS